MKKIIALSILSVAFAVATFAQKKEVTLEDIWQKRTFSPRYVSGFNFLNDGKHYTKQSYSQMKSVHQIIKYDLTTGEKVETVFDGENLKELDDKLNGRFSNYNYNADESKIIFATASESIYRHSSKANFYIYDIKSKVLEPLSENGKQQLAIFNSTNDKVAFVRENNLFYKNMTNGKETQITTDGKWNHIINGACDWVYEEEFGQDRAFYWSPDGQNIAFMRFDEKAVKEFSMPMYYNGAYPEQYSFKYPKAGETNAVVSVHIYNLKTGKITEVNTGEKGDIYFPRIKWTPDNQLCVFRLNRHQNHLKLLLANQKDGSTKVLLEEKNDYYIDIHDDLTFLKDGKPWGFAVLASGDYEKISLNWEVKDYLTAVSEQVGTYMQHHEAAQVVAENAQFAAFNRMSAFVLHDLKNVLAQVDLILANAQQHKHNPEFIEDTFETLEHTKARMEKMLKQLTDKKAVEEGVNSEFLLSEL